jgi:hypothetical protein
MNDGTMFKQLSSAAVGLRLARIRGDDLLLCEPMRFEQERDAIHTLLRRAMLSGRVELDGEIANHFADVLDSDGDIVGTVALDAKSYGILKNRWMRCKVERY